LIGHGGRRGDAAILLAAPFSLSFTLIFLFFLSAHERLSS
jgi:hypothetical protein